MDRTEINARLHTVNVMACGEFINCLGDLDWTYGKTIYTV